MNKLLRAILATGILVAASLAGAAEYDIVILNGRVMDPVSKFDGVRNVGIKDGKIADITILNPKTVRENSDYAPGKNGLPTTGIPYVLVNGNIVVRDSKVDLKVRAGQPIREDIIM
jgi:N-acyl-D-aspartate/D-glutamate deacylase